jgi:hypothetical protein
MIIMLVMRSSVIPAPAIPAVVIAIVRRRPAPDMNRRIIPHRRIIDYRVIRPCRNIIIGITE